MSDKLVSRRDLLKGTVAATAAMAAGCAGIGKAGKAGRGYDAKGLPTVVLGNTGARVPRIGYGCGSRFYAVEDEDRGLEMLTYALDHGLYYWDTAHDYASETVISEERIGKVLKHRRDEVFLSTKVGAREPDEAKRHIEESLTRLQTDHLDILKVHSLNSVEDLDNIARKGGVLDVLRKMRDEGVARFIGFSGHRSATAMATAARRYDFDTMLIALNHYEDEIEDDQRQNFESKAVPVAAEHGLGVMLIKVIRPHETIATLTPRELIRYALSLEHANAAVISMDSLDVVKENITVLKSFRPMDKENIARIRVALAPFYRHEKLPWMQQPGYRDGLLA